MNGHPGQFGLKKTSGFTLVELLIVIVIIAILAAITIIAYNGVTAKAHTASLESTLAQNVNLLEQANATNGTYPTNQIAANLKVSDGVTPTYVAMGAGYCIAVSEWGQSYYETDTVKTPTSGTCAAAAIPQYVATTGSSATNAAPSASATLPAGSSGYLAALNWTPDYQDSSSSVKSSGPTSFPTTPAGWSLVSSTVWDSSDPWSGYLDIYVATSSSPSTTFTWGSGEPGYYALSLIGYDRAVSAQAHATTRGSSSPSVTTTSGTLVASIIADSGQSTSSLGCPSGATIGRDSRQSSNSRPWYVLNGTAHRTVSAAGATGAAAWTGLGASYWTDPLAATVALVAQ